MKRKSIEAEHDFVLVLTGITESNQQIEDALFEAGCDDATISVRSGRVFIRFSRTAASVKDAVLSAIRDGRKADVGADVLRVDDCTLVTQSDIARKTGRSRQMVHQYIAGVRGPGGFPPPACDIHEGGPVWYWCEVAYWLWQNDMIGEDALREAQEVATINSVLEIAYHSQLDPRRTAEIVKSVGIGQRG